MTAPSDERWLPPEVDAAPQPVSTWVPETLRQSPIAHVIDSFAYVVVDEIVGDSLGLSISRWPGVDPAGRLVFPEAGQRLVGADRGAFEQFVRGNRVVLVMAPQSALDDATASAIPEREIRIGDVLAIPEDALDDASGGADRTHAAFEGVGSYQLFDISFDARAAAKLAASAAVAPPVGEKQAAEFIGDVEASEPRTVIEQEAARPIGIQPDGSLIEPGLLGETRGL